MERGSHRKNETRISAESPTGIAAGRNPALEYLITGEDGEQTSSPKVASLL